MPNGTPAPAINAPAGASEFVTNLAAAVGLAAVPDGAGFAIIQAETQNVRWRDDGSNPTATVGHLLAAGSTLRYEGPLLSVKFIETAPSAKINVAYYK